MRAGDRVRSLRAADHSGAASGKAEDERLRARLARERKARAEAEEIAERTLRDLYERQRELELLEAVAAAANAAPGIDEAMQVAVDGVCELTRWPVGHVYMRGESSDAELVPTNIWHLDDASRFEAFRTVTEATTLRRGAGLPGRILESGRPTWIADVTDDRNFPRARASTDIGVRGAFGFPALAGDEVVAVLEFFTPVTAEPDRGLLELLAHVGSQLGRVVERTRAREELTTRSADLARHARELELANADLSEFAYVVSHDLSEPLRTVAGFVQLLAERYGGQLDEDADEFITYAVEGTERMRSLIDDLLAYSRIGRRSLDREEVDCSRIIGRVEQALAKSIADAGASIEVGELPSVRADADQLERLFSNLVSNAIKFRGPDPPLIRVVAEPGRKCWRFSVVDNGIGIEERHAERIFKVFQRLHGPTEYPGTGIGLSVCRKVVERHGGRIWVESAAGGGSAFRFTIPVPEEASDDQRR